MTADKSTAQEDLAFLRQILSPDQDAAQTRYFGQMYALWGTAFAVPLFMEWLRIIGLAPLPDYFWVLASVVVTVGIIVVSIVTGVRARPALGMQARAANAVFAGIGWANLAVLAGLIFVAYALRDGRVMMAHAVVVFAFQGAAWYAVWALRKRPFAGLVAAGWYGSAAIAGAAVARPDVFVLLCAIFLVLLMVFPGVVMARAAKPD
jgi:hypothetical protein